MKRGMKKAGFWRRFAAVLIDGLITSPFIIVDHWSWSFEGNYALSSLAFIVYETILVSQWGGYTVGKKIMGIRVVTTAGKQLDWVKSFVRAVSKILSGIPFGLGYFWMRWDKKSQTWHDKIADTFVVEA